MQASTIQGPIARRIHTAFRRRNACMYTHHCNFEVALFAVYYHLCVCVWGVHMLTEGLRPSPALVRMIDRAMFLRAADQCVSMKTASVM